ncbi:MAG: hypothetical protein KBG29_12775, partial [Pseudomonadales bacterium]|nr:hypothetical protein [Pseudomonadales bacterium]
MDEGPHASCTTIASVEDRRGRPRRAAVYPICIGADQGADLCAALDSNQIPPLDLRLSCARPSWSGSPQGHRSGRRVVVSILSSFNPGFAPGFFSVVQADAQRGGDSQRRQRERRQREG